MPFLGEIPLDMAIRETSDAGLPIVVTQPDSPHARAYLEIAAKVAAAVDSGSHARQQPRIVVN